MYSYRLYDFDYDDTKSCVLYHKKKFEKDQFEKIVNKCINRVNGRLKRNKKILFRNEELSDEQIEKLGLWDLSGYWDIYKNVYKMLISDYGFQELQIECTFTFRDGFFGGRQKTVNKVID
jgi:hypothetical protein